MDEEGNRAAGNSDTCISMDASSRLMKQKLDIELLAN